MDHLTCPTENSIRTSGIPKHPGNDSTCSLTKTLWKSHPKRVDTRSVNFLVAGGKLMSACTEEVPRGRQRGVSWWRRTEGVKNSR